MALTSTAMLLALQATNAVTSAVDQNQQGRYAQSVSNTNASLAERNARDAILRGGEAAHERHAQTRKMVGSGRAAAAAQGIDPDSGSALDLTSEARTIGELDEITLMNNAARESWGYKVEAAGHRESGRQAAQAGRTGAISTLLTGGAQAWGSYAEGAGSRSSVDPNAANRAGRAGNAAAKAGARASSRRRP